ncbi:MAG: hypothetical protein EZS28_050891, partial [Streblomastix strix]
MSKEEKKVKKTIATRPTFVPSRRFTREKKSEQLAKILESMRQRCLKLNQGISQAELQFIEEEICHLDAKNSAAEAHVSEFATTNPAAKRRICTKRFLNSLLQELYKTNIRINNERKLVGEKYKDNVQRYDQNINARLIEPSMNLRSNSPVFIEEQQINALMNVGSPRQKQFLSRQVDSEFANQSQAGDLRQSSFFDDVPP